MNVGLPYVTRTVPLAGVCWFLAGADIWLCDGEWECRYRAPAPRMLLNGVWTA